jgi:undecaprenyl-diphosphatase
VSAIGPNGSRVGFATLNKAIHNLTGVNMILYVITDWLGLVPIFTALCFSILGIIQLIKRKSILKVDRSIISLGVFYIAVISVYTMFEYVVINYRPVLINGYLEASYPSSTTMLTLTVMVTAIIQLRSRIKAKTLKTAITLIIALFTAFMVIGRALSGVHWITDIIGGILISLGLIFMYYYAHTAWKS